MRTRRLWALLAAAAAVAGCEPTDGPKTLVNDTLEVRAQEFVFHQFKTDYVGTYTLTATPKGGDVDIWMSPGLQEPRFELNDDGRVGRAKTFAAGKEDTLTGPLDWGGAHVAIHNRGSSPVKVKCKLIYIEQRPK